MNKFKDWIFWSCFLIPILILSPIVQHLVPGNISAIALGVLWGWFGVDWLYVRVRGYIK